FRVTRRPLPWNLSRRLRSWPKLFAAVLGAIPLLLLGYLVTAVLWNGLQATWTVGLGELLATEFRSTFSGGGIGQGAVFGLLGAVWGTCLQVTLAMLFALPVSLALAISASETSNLLVKNGIRLVLGVFAGIPPIVYALGAIVFIQVIMLDKFT